MRLVEPTTIKLARIGHAILLAVNTQRLDMAWRERDLLSMREIAHILQIAGFALYALPILWCTFTLVRKSEVVDTIEPLRRYRKMGPLLGLSLGMCIAATIVGYWIDHGTFDLDWTSPNGRKEAATLITKRLIGSR